MSKAIILSDGKVAIVDDDDFEALSKFRWQSKVSGRTAYAQRTFLVGGVLKNVKMHREILGLKIGDKRHVDHINGDGLDNRRANFRFVTPRQNQCNSRKRLGATSRFKGVYWSNQKHRWHAEIKIVGQKRHIGYFDQEVDAARAYDSKAKASFGEFARTNEMMGLFA